MSDSWSPYSDTQVDQQTDADQLLNLSGRLKVCAEQLGLKGYSSPISEDISKELLKGRQHLTHLECGLQFAKDLAVANQLIASRSDHRSVAVLKYCLQQFAEYLVDAAEHEVDYPAALLPAFNELCALQKKPLLTENLFSIPDDCRIEVNDLQVSDQDASTNTVPEQYLGFSQTMLGVYRGESREQKLNDFGHSLETLAASCSNPKAQGFWLLCKAFALTVEIPKGELSPALFKIFKEIESVLLYSLGDKQSPVLGMQQKVDRLLVNLLCYTPANALPESFIDGEFAKEAKGFAGMEEEFLQLHQSTQIEYSAWLQISIHVLADRLQHCAAVLSEEALDTDESVAGLLAEVTLLKRLLILIGVHGVRENLEEVENYLRSTLSSENMQAGFTSVQLVEQQMFYQFDFLQQTADDESEDASRALSPAEYEMPRSEVVLSPVIATPHHVVPTNFELAGAAPETPESELPDLERPEIERLELEKPVSGNVIPQAPEPGQPAQPAPQDFGERCNLCIDVIQQSLDTALGSSGNLIPDSSVVNALSKLIDLVSSRGIDELAELLLPLSKLLTEARGSTLNQSETLLVQEAIIAATLGIDSLVGLKPMPSMVADVTGRVEQVLQTTSKRLSGASAPNSALSGFIVEAGELLPRLFELFQRLRGAPDGSSRLYGDINRLLHSFKVSADEADELHLAELAHTLEATMVDLTQSDSAASQNFFDIAIESIECLDEDIEHLRNSEPAVDRSDLIDRLKLEGAVERPRSVFENTSLLTGGAIDQSSALVNVEISSEVDAKGEASRTEEQAGVVLLNSVVDASNSIDWPDRFRQIEACYSAIDHSHKQLLNLQRRAAQLVNAAAGDHPGNDTESRKTLQSLTEQLQQIAENQNTAVRRLDSQLSNASLIEAASMGEVLLKTVNAAAIKRGLVVQFAFESGGVKLHSHMYEQISAATSVLLESIVTHALPDKAKAVDVGVASGHAGLSTVTVRVQQNERAILVDVLDDGCGVVVRGSAPRSGSPWANVARPDWREIEGNVPVPPQAWSKQSDQVVNINGLLKVATGVGGTVAVKSNEQSTCYRLCLPVAESTHTVLVFEVHNALLSIPVAKVESVGFAEDADVISLASVMGLKSSDALSPEQQSICVRTASGPMQFTVARVVGNKTLKFTAAGRLLPDVPGYIGVSVATPALEPESLVMLLDVDYWASQQP